MGTYITVDLILQIQPQFTDRGVQGQKGCITVSHGITTLRDTNQIYQRSCLIRVDIRNV